LFSAVGVVSTIGTTGQHLKDDGRVFEWGARGQYTPAVGLDPAQLGLQREASTGPEALPAARRRRGSRRYLSAESMNQLDAVNDEDPHTHDEEQQEEVAKLNAA